MVIRIAGAILLGIVLFSANINIGSAQLTATPNGNKIMVTHVVQAGETLLRIAALYSVSVDELAAANHIANTDKIYAGQTLLIPLHITPTVYVAPTLTPSRTKLFPIPATATPTEPIPTETSTPTETTIASQTATPTRVADLGIITSTASPIPPHPTTINGIDISKIVYLSDSAAQNIRAIYAHGQALRRNAHSFTALGDSIIEHGYFLERFDSGPYNLGDYGYLQPTINYFAGSFAHESVAVRRGLHTWSVLDPMWAERGLCTASENMLACEIRRSNPSILIIQLGTNDVGQPQMTDQDLREIVEYAINQGVIPILGTKADRFEGSDINNTLIRKITADYKLPLWDFDLVAATIPNRGLDQDGIHMTTFYAHDWSSPVAFTRGHGVHSLTALIMLDSILRIVSSP